MAEIWPLLLQWLKLPGQHGVTTDSSGSGSVARAPIPGWSCSQQTPVGPQEHESRDERRPPPSHNNIFIVLLSQYTFGFTWQTKDLHDNKHISAHLRAHARGLLYFFLVFFSFCSWQKLYSLICSEGRVHGVTQPSVLGIEHGKGLSPLHQRCQENRQSLFHPFSQVTDSWQLKPLLNFTGFPKSDSLSEARGLCSFFSESYISLTSSIFE